MRFYWVGSRLRRATLGTLPPLTLADARQLAREALRNAAGCEDPAAAKREAREALTVVALVRDYIDAAKAAGVRQRMATIDEPSRT